MVFRASDIGGTLAFFPAVIKRAGAPLLVPLVNALLPPTCVGCQQRLPGSASLANSFCPTCYAGLPWWNPALVIPPLLPPGVADFRAPLLYAGAARELILRFKFHDGTHLAPTLARLLLPLLAAAPDAVLVPVPLHPTRLRQRFYNQAALLAGQLGKLSSRPVAVDGLQRLVQQPAQASRTRAQRQQLPGSHFAAAARLQGRPVVLIDDILTTGSTARACALALKRAGAGPVSVLTLAYTPPG